MYRRPFLFVLPDSKVGYRSLIGSVLSLFTVIIIFGYAFYKLGTLNSLEDYKINFATHEQFYDSSFSFSQIDGFQIAAAVTSYDGVVDSIEDPEIGVLRFYLKQWGVNGKPGITFLEVASRPCTEADFNWDDNRSSASKFFPIN